MRITRKWKKLPFKFWLALTVFFLLLSICGITITSIIWYLASQLIYSYGIVIDAGSTSTKVYLYAWPEIGSRTNGEVFEVEKCKFSPGISAFVDNIDTSYIGIKYCLEEELLPKIPQRMRKKSFVYLGATAGMRLVEEVNPNATSQIFAAVGKYLLSADLKFNKFSDDLKIISGVVEGIGAWISVNYLKGTLQNSKLSNLIYPKEKKTYGALDLGGASTQIAFVPDVVTNEMKEKTIRLYGYNYSVSSHSFLCYGKTQAGYRHLAHLIQNYAINNEINGTIKELPLVLNPCMLKGDSFIYPLNQIITEPCIFGEYALKNFGYEIKYPLKLLEKMVNITFQGSGDVETCQQFINKLFSTKKCNFDKCSFNNIYIPTLTDRFLAFSGFNLVHKLLKKRSMKNLDYTEFESSSKEYCEEKAPIINEKNMQIPRYRELEIFRKWRCFDFLYVFNLLKNLGFNEKNWKSIQFISKVRNANLGWSLGYMINRTALVPIEQPLISMNLGTFLALLIIFLFILSLGFLFGFITICWKRPLNSRNSRSENESTKCRYAEEISLCKV